MPAHVERGSDLLVPVEPRLGVVADGAASHRSHAVPGEVGRELPEPAGPATQSLSMKARISPARLAGGAVARVRGASVAVVDEQAATVASHDLRRPRPGRPSRRRRRSPRAGRAGSPGWARARRHSSRSPARSRVGTITVTDGANSGSRAARPTSRIPRPRKCSQRAKIRSSGTPRAGGEVGDRGAVAGPLQEPGGGRVDRQHGEGRLGDDAPGTVGPARAAPIRAAGTPGGSQ